MILFLFIGNLDLYFCSCHEQSCFTTLFCFIGNVVSHFCFISLVLFLHQDARFLWKWLSDKCSAIFWGFHCTSTWLALTALAIVINQGLHLWRNCEMPIKRMLVLHLTPFEWWAPSVIEHLRVAAWGKQACFHRAPKSSTSGRCKLLRQRWIEWSEQSVWKAYD